MPPMILPAVSYPAPTSASGAATPEKTTIAEITTPMMLSPTIKPDASNTPSCFVASGFARAVGRAIEEPTDDRADHDHECARSRQINSEPHRERRNAHVFRCFRKNRVEHDDADADVDAHPDQAPIDVRGDDALRERRNQAGLRSRQRIGRNSAPGAPTKP